MEATVQYLKLSYLLRAAVLVVAAAYGLRGSAAHSAATARVPHVLARADGIVAARQADCAALGPYQVGATPRYQLVRPGALTTATWPGRGTGIGVPYGWHGRVVIATYSGCGQGATTGTILVGRGFAVPVAQPGHGAVKPATSAVYWSLRRRVPVAQPGHGAVKPLIPCAGPCEGATGYSIVGISGTFATSAPSQAPPATVRLNVAITTTAPMTRSASGTGMPCSPTSGCIGTRTVTRTVTLFGLTGQIDIQPEERRVTLAFTLPAMAGSGAPTAIVLYGSRGGGAPLVR